MTDIAIKVENLSKRYRIGLKEERADTLAGAITGAIQRPFRNLRRLRRLTNFESQPSNLPSCQPSNRSDTIWALKDVSFEIKRGEVVGIIGRNGAGKSTLLKILSRITEPTSGRAVISGRVGSLLEVGTGFHQELTGRENIYMNGTILGMAKAEVDRKFDEIVDFSGVERFIDTPVKHYSSGMRVRLAFSVAAHLEPEILLIDEVLAVGDAAFQRKCLGKMGEVAGEGRTVLFVSHNMSAVEHLCASALLLQQGGLAHTGEVRRCIRRYLDADARRPGSILDHITRNDPEIRLDNVTVNGLQSDVLDLPLGHRHLDIEVSGEIDQAMRLLIEARIYDSHERCLAFFTPRQFRDRFALLPAGSFRLSEGIHLPYVNEGEFMLNLYISRAGYPRSLVHIERSVRIKAQGTPTVTGWVFKYARGNGWMLLPCTPKELDPRDSALLTATDHRKDIAGE